MSFWVKIYSNLSRHPKQKKFQQLMGLKLDESIGLLVRFWHSVAEVEESGIFPETTDKLNIAFVMTPEPDNPEKFVDALIKSELLDTNPYRIRNWLKYAEPYLRGKYKNNPGKWQKIKDAWDPFSCQHQDQENDSEQTPEDHPQERKKNRGQPTPRSKTAYQLAVEEFAATRGITLENQAMMTRFFKTHGEAAKDILDQLGGDLYLTRTAIKELAAHLDMMQAKATADGRPWATPWSNLDAIAKKIPEWKAEWDASPEGQEYASKRLEASAGTGAGVEGVAAEPAGSGKE